MFKDLTKLESVVFVGCGIAIVLLLGLMVTILSVRTTESDVECKMALVIPQEAL